MKTIFAIATAATLLSPVVAGAQAVEPPTQPKVNLTLQDRYTIKEIMKDVRVTPAPAGQPTSIGTEVPDKVKLEPVPAEVAAKVPKIKSHLFFVEDHKIVLVQAKDRKIVDVIE
ncbi:MAG TPA: DUF1236 domain-containing protein [Xanthobacteraceae bacterium]|jgi:hypothetical protein